MQYKVLYFFSFACDFFHGAFPKISEGDDDLYIGMPSYRRHFVSQSGVGRAAVSDFFVSWSDQTLKPYRNTMKFFVDTANLDQIREAHAMGVLDGVTTNPSLMARENIRGEEACRRHYVEICRIVQGDVSAEVISTDFEGMVREGEALAALDPHIVVKLPCTAEGIRAVRHFAERGIRTNCTLVFSVGQALLAAKAGATYVSPFVGRLDDISEDGVELVAHIVRVYRTYGFRTQVLAASIRHTRHIIQCLDAGADVATCPLSAIKGLLRHPLTESGLAQFLADHARVNG